MASKQLTDLVVGDKVKIKRNLDHPAFMIRGPYDEYEGRHQLIRDPGLDEDLGIGAVTEYRHDPGTQTGWRDRAPKTTVRLNDGFWYDCADGHQEHSRARIIEMI